MGTPYNEVLKELEDFSIKIRAGSIFDDSQKIIDEILSFKNDSKIKCVFIGKLSSGKSSIINALLDNDCLPTGPTEVTVCFFTVEATDKDYEYFTITNRIDGFFVEENENISNLTAFIRLNYDVKAFPDTDSIMKVYLDKNNEILKNGMVLVDCPGYDRGYVDTIQDLCNDADIINVVIDINEGITDNTAKDIKEISKVLKSGPTTFIYNKCENMSDQDKETAKKNIKKHFDIDSRFKSKQSENQIFFLSELTPGKKLTNDVEFLKFKRFLENLPPIINISRKNGFVQLIGNIKALPDKIEKSVPLIEDIQLRNIQNTKQSRMDETSELSDLQINEMFKMIDKTVDANQLKCNKDTADLKVASICDDVNKMISEFLEQSCLRSNKIIIVKDGEATKKANGIFYKMVFVASDIKINNYHWYNNGDKTTEVEANFKKYLHKSPNENQYKETIRSHYKEKMAKFLDCALRERTECIKYREALIPLVTKLLENTNLAQSTSNPS